MADNALHLTEATFDTEIKSHPEVLMVDFWAEWCAPCRAIAPTLEELSRESSGKVSLAKVNVDDNPALAQRYAIQSIPTLLYFVEGSLRAKIVGTASKEAILSKLRSVTDGRDSQALNSDANNEMKTTTKDKEPQL